MRMQTWIDTIVLCLPFAVLSIAAVSNLAIGQNILVNSILLCSSAFFIWSFIWQAFGRILALALSFLLWVVFSILSFLLFLQFFSPFLAYIITGIMLFLVSTVVYRTAVIMGQDRYQTRIERGKAIVEWEWVYTGRDFALSHRLARVPFGVYLTYVFLAALLVKSLIAANLAWVDFLTISLGLAYAVLLCAGFVFAIKRHPVTYPLTFLLLILQFPWSIPFLVYWADGTRPNLIYRHRFERLVPSTGEGAYES